METPKQSPDLKAKVDESQPEKPLTDEVTSKIAGGQMGGDDDLDDLEVERLRGR